MVRRWRLTGYFPILYNSAPLRRAGVRNLWDPEPEPEAKDADNRYVRKT
jgi:hypothetical protein